jgi:hypothetical protein
LLRRRGRRGFRRLVYLSALVGLLILAPAATGAPPIISVTISGTLGLNGWYRSNVTVNWQVEGETSSVGCDTQTLSVDTPLTKLTCSAENTPDGTSASQTVSIKIDKTPPTAGGLAERPPNASGWYTTPLTVSFAGTDATSGIASCSSTRYAGPDNAAAAVTGSCSDVAGNVSGGSILFRYDVTPPSLGAVRAALRNRSVQLSWRPSADTLIVEVVRSPGRGGQGETMVYRGSETGYLDTGLTVGRTYQYRVSGFDEAGNKAEHTFSVVATGALLSPAPGARLASPPRLVWTPARGATYYNIQIIIRGRKVLSAWPTRPSFRLRRTWLYKGRRYRLRPGVYRWYVWPGYGRISAARYARRALGSSTFVVTG